MILSIIIRNIAIKSLGKPGTMVECMEGCGDVLVRGKQYIIESVVGNAVLDLKDFQAYENGWCPTRFRIANK